MKRRIMVLREFKCCECGCAMVFSKNAGRKTGNGHIKDAYCYKCRKQTKFSQVDIK